MSVSIDKATAALQSRIVKKAQYQGEISITVKRADLYGVMEALKNEFGFNYFVDCFAIDHYRDEERYELVYNIMNLDEPARLRVKTLVEENDTRVDSLVSIWPAANWNERETYDMHGIIFNNHPDPRRMFMPEDFEYFPLRKEFPLIGIPGSIQMPEKDGPKGYK